MKIFIATPMYGGLAHDSYILSLQNLVEVLTKSGHTVSTTTIGNESLVTRARNTLSNLFMKTDFDFLLFIDADHGWDSTDVLKMVESGKDLIGAICPIKIINWENVRLAALAGKTDLERYSGSFAVNLLPNSGTFNLQSPLLVKDIGTGMMLISRKVFESITPICKSYINTDPGRNGIPFGEPIVEYFTTFIDEENILLSEDYAFCSKWRSTGGDVWAAPWVGISHSGTYEFMGKFSSWLEISSMSKLVKEAHKNI